MYLIFNRDSARAESNHLPIKQRIHVPLGKIRKQGITFQSADDWIDHIKAFCHATGMTECAYDIENLPKLPNRISINFHFATQRDRAVVTAYALGNITRQLTQTFRSATNSESAHSEAYLREFAQNREISLGLSRISPRSYIVTTSNLFDELAVAVHMADFKPRPQQPQLEYKQYIFPALEHKKG